MHLNKLTDNSFAQRGSGGNTAIRLLCRGPVTSRIFICSPDVMDFVDFRLTYPRSDQLLTKCIAGRDIHPRYYVNIPAKLHIYALVPTALVVCEDLVN